MEKSKMTINKFYEICLYLSFFATSYAYYVPTSMIDDAIVMIIGVLIVLQIIKKMRINYKIAITIIAIIIEILWSIIVSKISDNTIWSFIAFLKIYILILLSMYVHFDNRDKVIKNLAIISIPNILIGLWQFFQTYILGMTLEGKYEVLNATRVYRVEGATTHPLYFSLLMVGLVLYYLYISKSKIRYIMVAICTGLCLLTYSSFANVIVIGLVIFKFFPKTQAIISLLKNHAKLWMFLAIVASVIFFFNYMLSEVNTIRYIAARDTISSLNYTVFFLGRGFGSYLDANYSEAYIFRIIYENGILGVIIFLIILLKLISMQIKNKNYLGLFIIFVYILNIFINEGYMVPYIFFIPIYCSEIINGKLIKESQDKTIKNLENFNVL